MSELLSALPLLLQGAALSFAVASSSFLLGCTGGIFLGCANSDYLRTPLWGRLIDLFVLCARGTPLTIQVLIAFFFVPDLLSFSWSPVTAGICTLGINSMAYVAEIVRGGFNGIPMGQWEVSHTMGYSQWATLVQIIFPQLFRSIFPALVGEYINLIKESGILLIIGVQELSKISKEAVARDLNFSIYLLAALLYFCMTGSITYLGKRWEQRRKIWST